LNKTLRQIALNPDLSLVAKGLYYVIEAYQKENSKSLFDADLRTIESICGLTIAEISDLRIEIIDKHLKKLGWKTEC